jgi:hypothetical protein
MARAVMADASNLLNWAIDRAFDQSMTLNLRPAGKTVTNGLLPDPKRKAIKWRFKRRVPDRETKSLVTTDHFCDDSDI